MNGVLGLGGWQWVFLLEAAPAVLLGVDSLRLADRQAGTCGMARRGEQQGWLIGKAGGRSARARRG